MLVAALVLAGASPAVPGPAFAAAPPSAPARPARGAARPSTSAAAASRKAPVPATSAASPSALPVPAPAPTKPAPSPTHVEAANIEYQYREKRTVMTGKPLVTLRRDDAILVCRRMVAENDDAGDIRHAVCTGDVKLTRGEQIVTCQQATYDAPAATIVCTGDTVLKDGASVLHSTEVTYDIERDRVLARNSKGTIFQRPGQKLPAPRERAR